MRPPRSFSFWLGAGVLAVLVVAAVLAPVLAPYGPSEAGPLNASPSFAHPLGTTGQGFDVLSQFLYGARTSFLVSFSVAGLTTLIGIAVGLVSAYAGGWVDDVLSLLTNVFLALPGVPLMVVLAAFLPPGELTIILVLTFTGWSFGARLFRSQALSLREREFIAASRLAREARWRIIVVELLPNMLSITVAYLINQVIYAITAEAGLEFLGLGHSSKVTWGHDAELGAERLRSPAGLLVDVRDPRARDRADRVGAGADQPRGRREGRSTVARGTDAAPGLRVADPQRVPRHAGGEP
ncbi:ABC transporter permease [Kribbella sp. WER1]